MFGISFDGHPGLRHLYLPGEFEGHPLRKDFPLLARLVKPWPGIVDVEPMPGEPARPPPRTPRALPTGTGTRRAFPRRIFAPGPIAARLPSVIGRPEARHERASAAISPVVLSPPRRPASLAGRRLRS